MQLQKHIITLIFLAISIFSFSQQDPDAKKILDEFSSKSKSYNAYSANYTLLTENHQNGDVSETKGNIVVKGKKYRLNINKVEVYFDGTAETVMTDIDATKRLLRKARGESKRFLKYHKLKKEDLIYT